MWPVSVKDVASECGVGGSMRVASECRVVSLQLRAPVWPVRVEGVASECGVGGSIDGCGQCRSRVWPVSVEL